MTNHVKTSESKNTVLNPLTPEQRASLVAMLQWYDAMGVDCAVAEKPTDWRQHEAAEKRHRSDAKSTDHAPRPPLHTQSNSNQTGNRFAAPTPPAEAQSKATELARSAKTLDELKSILEEFDGCALKTTAKNTCFYRGSPTAPLAIIGEAPGRDEDIAGRPFVGRAGQLLDKMLASIGLTEADVHITNVVYWRPPGNRTPTPLETQICRPFLDRQLELLNPKMVLVLGGSAAKTMLNVNDGIMRLRGKWREIDIAGHAIPVMASLHPAYLLRTPAAKRLAWRDLLAVQHAQKDW